MTPWVQSGHQTVRRRQSSSRTPFPQEAQTGSRQAPPRRDLPGELLPQNRSRQQPHRATPTPTTTNNTWARASGQGAGWWRHPPASSPTCHPPWILQLLNIELETEFLKNRVTLVFCREGVSGFTLDKPHSICCTGQQMHICGQKSIPKPGILT